MPQIGSKFVIDLNSSEGNVFYILGALQALGRTYPHIQVEPIFQMIYNQTSYDEIIAAIKAEAGDYIQFIERQ